MPEQQSRRGVTVSGNLDLSQPFETPSVRFGTKGLNLKVSADLVPSDEYRVLTNALHHASGEVTARPGLIELNHTDDIHSVRRITEADGSDWTRIWGVGQSVGIGKTTITELEGDFFGRPFSLVPYRPPLSNESWMYVTDRNKGRKVALDGTILPISLTAPTAVITATASPKEITRIVDFGPEDGTDGAAWTKNAGFDYSEEPIETVIPAANDFGGFDGGAIEFVAQPGTAGTDNPVAEAEKGYYSFWGLPLTRNLSVVGTETATDEDLIHLWVKFSHPFLTAEFRIYFVCSEAFSPSDLPGTSEGVNTDFYFKTFRQNDFAAFLAAAAAQIDAAEIARIRAVRDQDLANREIDDDRPSWEERRAERDPARTISLQAGAGVGQWVEYGVVGTPVRRGDFQRVGSTEGRDWSTITGIIIYMQTVDGTGGQTAVSLDHCYLTGGFGPDTAEPGAQQLDYRYTHYDPRTGDESNPSPEQDPDVFLDSLRQKITLTPTPYGRSGVRQRFYRRGGALTADWYFLGENDSDGGTFDDILTDAAIEGAGTLELDNDAFVTSVDDDGDAVLGQPCEILFGPDQDMLFAIGDPRRPGDVYYCKPGQPGSWPASNHTEVTAPSEPLMNGGVFGGQPFVLSTERGYILYPNLSTSGSSVTAVPTECRKGLKGRWGMAIGHGFVWFVSEDGIYRTNGGPAEPISDPIRPLFFGQDVEGYKAVDYGGFSDDIRNKFLRLCIHNFDLHFLYHDVDGLSHELVYSILYDYWRSIERSGSPPPELQSAYSDEGSNDLIYGGGTSNRGYVEGGTTDDGSPIAVTIRPGDSAFGRPREDKRLGDLYLDADRAGVTLSVIPRLNHGLVVNNTQLVEEGSGRERYILNPFGTEPQQARTATCEFSWSSSATPPILYQWGASIIPQPDVTISRVTQWEDLQSPDEVYLTGVTLDVDTFDGTKTFYVEYDNASTPNTWSTLGPFTIDHDKRHKAKFSWPVVKAELVRIRPDGDCLPWQLFRVDWIFQPEPPRIAAWDINWENDWDQYITGVDLDCDTFGETKSVNIYIDQVLIHTRTVNTAARAVVHLTVQPPVRGHLLRFTATDAHPGLLYAHRWHTDPEPSEQTNWNQNYSTWGYDSDKWLKALIFQCDTFAEDKQVTVEIDHEVVETLTVNANNRRVIEMALTEQRLGRVFRFLPVDTNPGRIYNITPVFDLEPLALTRWETQEVTAGIVGWKVALYGHITLKAPAAVTLTVIAYNQRGEARTRRYTLPKTGTAKVPQFVPFERTKGMLYKFVLTSSQPFWLYREESHVVFVPWGSAERLPVPVFGNDDLDPARSMGNSQLAAATPGGAGLR